MNGYERIKAALSGEMPDQRPVMLHGFMTAVRESGHTMKAYREDPAIAAQCHIDFVEKYDLDGVLFDVDTAILAGAVGVPVDFPENDPARTHLPLLKSLDEMSQLGDIDLSGNERVSHSLEAVKILKKYFGGQKYIRGNCDQAPFSLACAIRTPGDFMMDLIMDEERSLELIRYASKATLQYINLMAAAGADMVSNGDSPAGPSMISPDMYRKFALPFEQEVVRAAHACNIPYLLHICGDTTLILSHMAEVGMDAVELDYKTPVDRIYDFFHQKAVLFGTIDPSGVLALGMPDRVREECKTLLNVYRGHPGIVIGAGCALPPNTPEENIRALVRAAREMD